MTFITELSNIVIWLGVLFSFFRLRGNSKLREPPALQFRKRSGLFVAVITGSQRDKILSLQMDLWMREMIQKPYVSNFKFFGSWPLNSNNSELLSRYVDVQKTPGDRSRDMMVSKLFCAVDMFLNGSDNWLLRICDDAFIDLEVFPRLMEEVNMIGNPITDPIFQGNGIAKGSKKYAYLQGGTGMMISRAAAWMIATQKPEIINISRKIRHDDTAFGCWLYMNNISGVNTTSRWFLGHRFHNLGAATELLNLSIERIRKCPYTVPISYPFKTRGFFQRIKDIAIWHDRVNYLEFLPYVRQIKRTVPDNLWFYHVDNLPTLCIGVNESRLGYM